jgi:hypothetical protein
VTGGAVFGWLYREIGWAEGSQGFHSEHVGLPVLSLVALAACLDISGTQGRDWVD